MAIKKGGYVRCKGVAYYHGAPFEAAGMVGQVTRTDKDQVRVYFDTPSRGECFAHPDNLEGITKKAYIAETEPSDD